jgi:Zn-dependent protease
MKFSSTELQNLARAWAIISVAFAIVLNGGFGLTQEFLTIVIVSAITVGLGFLLHELMHKYFAQKYGCHAEFRAFDKMLLIALGMSFFGFIFAAPGAVFIQGNINISRNGRISAAGPATNIVLGFAFILLGYAAIAFYPLPILLLAAKYGAIINGWLAIFNMLPIMGLDGTKVLAWDKKIYASIMILAIGMMYIALTA